MSYEQVEYEDKESLIRRATFGKQVEHFINSDIGRYLLTRAFTEAEEAMDALKICNPSDWTMVQQLQNKAKQGDAFKTWLETAVNDGLQAINIIEDRGGL